MSSGNVSSDSPPKDIEWRPIYPPIPPEIIQLGRDAIKALHIIPPPKFDAVEDACIITLSFVYAKLYALIIKVTPANGIPVDYLVIVLADLQDKFKQLVTYGDYSPAH